MSELRRPCHVSKAAASCRFTDALRSRHDSIVDARSSVRPSVVSISCLALLPAATAAADAQPIFVGSFRTWTFVPRTSDPCPNLMLNPDALNPTQTGGGPISGAGANVRSRLLSTYKAMGRIRYVIHFITSNNDKLLYGGFRM